MRITRDKHVHYMAFDTPPVSTIKPKEIVTVETMDALDGQIVDVEGNVMEEINDRRYGKEDVNPATGPLFIEGVEPGDGVAVHILDIRPVGVGFMGVREGALDGAVTKSIRKFFDSSDNKVRFNEDIVLEADPMVGVIGLAPEGTERVWNNSPGIHGGNMDATLIRKGSTVYFSAFHEGGLLALGDVHLLMADGEVNGQGIEINAEVDLSVEVIKGWGKRHPMVATDNLWACIASDESLEKACRIAAAEMVEFISERTQMPSEEAVLLLGLVGHMRVCQVVNPLRTARVEIPRSVLPQLMPQ